MANKNVTSQGDSDLESHDDSVISDALRKSGIVLVAIAVCAGVAVLWSLRSEDVEEIKETELAPVRVREMPVLEPPTVQFTDITREAGITFVHNNGATGDKLLPETMGGGCAFFDFDGDGDQDLLLVGSKDWDWDEPTSRRSMSALYRNDGGTFVDVTEDSGLDESYYGMGAAVGDYDNDGRVDVYVTTVGGNRLYRNLGDGKFENVTQAAGVAGAADAWSTSCGWLDFDNDGDLDLFSCNYVVWSRRDDQSQNFQLVGGGRAYGRPQNFEGTFPYLFRNDGDGKFTDVSEAAGIQIRNPATGVPLPKSLGLAFCDFDQDGAMDVVIANDTVQNILLQNTGQGTFMDVATVTGIAFDSMGNARGAMGIDVAAIRGQKAMAVAIGNFANEMTALYVTSPGQMQFDDEAISSGLGPNTRLQLTFGLFYIDYDLDGRLDLFCANGHLEEDINRVQESQFYEQPPQLFWNAGPTQDMEFIPLAERYVGADLLKPMVGRGATYADIDNDGDLDVLITASGRAPRLLRNDSELSNHWLRIKLVGDGIKCNRDAIGSWVEVKTAAGIQRRQVSPTRSYMSQTELPLTFGLGEDNDVESVTVHWADGFAQELENVELDRLVTVERSK